MAHKYRRLPLQRSSAPGLKYSYTTSDIHLSALPEHQGTSRRELPPPSSSSSGSDNGVAEYGPEYLPLLVPAAAQEQGRLHGVLQKLSRRRLQQRERALGLGKENALKYSTNFGLDDEDGDDGEPESRELLRPDESEQGNLGYNVGKRRRSIDNGSLKSPFFKKSHHFHEKPPSSFNKGNDTANTDHDSPHHNLKRPRSLAKHSNISLSLSNVVQSTFDPTTPRPPSSQSALSIEETTANDLLCQVPLLAARS